MLPYKSPDFLVNYRSDIKDKTIDYFILHQSLAISIVQSKRISRGNLIL